MMERINADQYSALVSFPIEIEAGVVIGFITKTIEFNKDNYGEYHVTFNDFHLLRESISDDFNIPYEHIGFNVKEVYDDVEQIKYNDIANAYYFEIPKAVLRNYKIKILLE